VSRRIPEDLKREFLSFLFLRGVDDELAWYLHHHFERKKVEEKLLNFEKIAAFMAQPVPCLPQTEAAISRATGV
jgi:hypothetical protein